MVLFYIGLDSCFTSIYLFGKRQFFVQLLIGSVVFYTEKTVDGVMDSFGNLFDKIFTSPPLPESLEYVNCGNNQLAWLPRLPESLFYIMFEKNPIHPILTSNSLFQIKQNIETLNHIRSLYYFLKYKQPLRKWLWEKVR